MHPQIRKFPHREFLFCLILTALIFSPLRAGAIEVTRADTAALDGTIHLDADATINLPESVQTALDKGVDLFFATDVKIIKDRKWLPDKALLNLEIVRRLSFHALTKKYVVDDLTLKQRKSFTSVSAALSYLGHYRKIPLVSDAVISPAPDMQARVRIRLMHRKLPLPLRLKRTFSRAWRLSSDWYAWSLRVSRRP